MTIFTKGVGEMISFRDFVLGKICVDCETMDEAKKLTRWLWERKGVRWFDDEPITRSVSIWCAHSGMSCFAVLSDGSVDCIDVLKCFVVRKSQWLMGKSDRRVVMVADFLRAVMHDDIY